MKHCHDYNKLFGKINGSNMFASANAFKKHNDTQRDPPGLLISTARGPLSRSLSRFLGQFLLPLDGTLVHRRVTPSTKLAGTHLYTWVMKYHDSKVSCTTQCPGQGSSRDYPIPSTACKPLSHHASHTREKDKLMLKLIITLFPHFILFVFHTNPGWAIDHFDNR